MQATTHTNLDADLSTMPSELRSRIKWRKVPGPNGRERPVAYFPIGTVFAGPQALELCKNRQAVPSDDECRDALGWTPDQVEQAKLRYQMDAIGLSDPGDRDLFIAGVISGIDANMEYIPGPNWESYAGLVKAVKTSEDI